MIPHSEVRTPHLSRAQLFLVFVKAGFAFGGGLSILGFLQDEFVTRRGLVSEQEFVRLFGISRLVPSGSVTALTVGFGHRLRGWSGSLVALAGLLLPGFAATVALTAAYPYLRGGAVLPFLTAVILPSALGLVAVAAINLTRAVVQTRLDVVLAAAALAAALLLDVNPTIVLLAGGVAGAVAFRPHAGADR